MSLRSVKIIFSVVLWCCVLIAATAFYFWNWLNTPQNIPEDYQIYSIEKGSNVHRQAKSLHEARIIRWPKVWVYYARLQGLNKIKVGEYRLTEKETPIALLQHFNFGETIQYQVTLIEGHNFKETIKTLHAHEAIKATLDSDMSAKQISLAGFDLDHGEGWFLPETYRFSRGDTDISILQRAHKAMRLTLDEQWNNRAENLPYTDAYQALVMASIIEKETGVPFERPDIAGVFVRRLQIGMRLQTDPTVIYGMGDAYEGNIRRRDLRAKTPYNTYVISGLPPTPIAMPGKAAIHAALNPREGDTLYFVAKGDGTHYFSKTLDEHNNAVNRYQITRVKNYRSSLPTKTDTVEK